MIKELNYELTKKDVFKFLFFHQFKNKLVVIGLLIIVLLIFISSICIYMYEPTNYLPLICIAIFIIAFLIGPVISICMFKKSILNIKIDSESPVIVCDNVYGHSELNWNQIHKLYKTKHSFLIYITKNQAIVIPKRIFENEQEMNETWELIQECYNKNRG